MNYRAGVIFLVLGIVAVAAFLIVTENTPLIFSPLQTMGALWNNYKMTDIDASGRTIDATRGNITTSEGESYTMLRAVWMDDKATFDTSWTWTKDNLHRPSDNLFAWLFGQEPNGSYGVLTSQGGETTASDADTDIALALTFAYARWQDPTYLSAAKAIASDIWNKEVVVAADGTPYLVADDLEKTSSSTSVLINPSYLNPAAYHVFELIDPSHPWQELIDSSYKVFDASIDEPLDASSSAGLPPDWVRLNTATDTLSPAGGSLDSNFGFDALRVPYRLALDYEWYGDPRDLDTLSKMQFLATTWRAQGVLDSTYTHAGAVVTPYTYETAAMYGGTLGYFLYEDPTDASTVYKKIINNFNPQTNAWRTPLTYYNDNWAWFGIGLYNHLLPNLAASLPPSAYQ